MQISADKVVLFHYTLRNDADEVLDSSEGKDPLPYLHGHQNIVPGLESALEGLSVGDKKLVTVPPEQAYGERRDDAVQNVPLTELPEEIPREEGLQIFAEGPDGQHFPLWITAVNEDTVTLDGNHPLAGQTLHFDVFIAEVRAAEPEELEHGHVHGPGGVEH